MALSEPETLVACLGRQLAPCGIDIVTPLSLSWYNNPTVAALGARIPARGAAGPSALCVLIANSRSLWEPFVEACASEGLLAQDNPLDAFLERRLTAALALCAPGLSRRVYWSHRRTDDLEGSSPEGASEHVAFQRMAHFAGLAYLDETSHLCLHPRFGPWFSLRCAIIFDDVPYTAPQPPELPNPLPLATRQYVALALHTAVHNTSKKFHLPEADVEAAEAALAEASREPELEGDSDEEEGEQEQGRGQARSSQAPEAAGLSSRAAPCPSSSARSTVGSDRAASGGTTPACSSGCSSPRARSEGGSEHAVATPEPPAGLPGTAADRLAAAAAAEPVAVPGGAAAEPAGPGSPAVAAGFGSPLQGGSPGGSISWRSSLERESKPSMRAVAANWRAWVAVRDSPCPGHPWRYSEEQITYHYTRDRSVLLKAMLRRNLGPTSPQLSATGLLDPALQAFHAATMAARQGKAAQALAAAAAVPTVATPGASPGPAAVTAA